MASEKTTNPSSGSEAATLHHIRRVNEFLLRFAQKIIDRAINHDVTKLQEPEKSGFEVTSVKLSQCTYGSPEYEASLKELKPILEHHYRFNSHHPEHYRGGIDDMDLLDILEMFADWMAASERQLGGSMQGSIDHNRNRFHMEGQLVRIFENTMHRYPATPTGDIK
jgi:hypothetical protein